MTAVNIDDESLDKVRHLLGTKTKRDTINAALREVIRAHATVDLVNLLDSDVFEYGDHETLHRDSWGYSASGATSDR